jgi:hypothetical protein
MRVTKKDLGVKILDILEFDGHQTAQSLAAQCKVKKPSIYRTIRLLREGKAIPGKGPIGVHPVRDGYVLSEKATPTDDVSFLRRLNGRRTSDYVALTAAQPSIVNRWSVLPGGLSDLKRICAPLIPSTRALNQGVKILLNRSKSLI